MSDADKVPQLFAWSLWARPGGVPEGWSDDERPEGPVPPVRARYVLQDAAPVVEDQPEPEPTPEPSAFVSRRARAAQEREEALKAALACALDEIADYRRLVGDLVSVCMLTRLAAWRDMGRDIEGLCAALDCAEAIGEREAARCEQGERAIDLMVERLLEFDDRCAEGDVLGAVEQLRAWIARVR